MYNGALFEAIKSQTKLDKSLRYKSYDKKPVFHTLAKKGTMVLGLATFYRKNILNFPH